MKARKSLSKPAQSTMRQGKRSGANTTSHKVPKRPLLGLYDETKIELERSSFARSSPKNRVQGYVRGKPGPGRFRSREEFANLRRFLIRMDRLVEMGYSQKEAASKVCLLLDEEWARQMSIERVTQWALRQARLSNNRSVLALPSTDEFDKMIAAADRWSQEVVKQAQRDAEAKPRRAVKSRSHWLMDSDNLRKYYRAWKRGALVL